MAIKPYPGRGCANPRPTRPPARPRRGSGKIGRPVHRGAGGPVDNSEESLRYFGRVADILGRKRIYGYEVLILAIGAIASAFAPNYTFLLVSRAVLGIGIGGDYPAARNSSRKKYVNEIVSAVAPSPSVPLITLVAEGDPAESLITAAREAELLVVGTRGRSPFAGLVLGSVSLRCSAAAQCPVVLVNVPGDGPGG